MISSLIFAAAAFPSIYFVIIENIITNNHLITFYKNSKSAISPLQKKFGINTKKLKKNHQSNFLQKVLLHLVL